MLKGKQGRLECHCLYCISSIIVAVASRTFLEIVGAEKTVHLYKIWPAALWSEPTTP